MQINNWNSARLEKQEEFRSYEIIKRQISDDLTELTEVRDYNKYYAAQCETANRIISSNDRNKIDSLAVITMKLSQYSDFHRSGNIYETLVNSGDLKLLRNPDVPANLQKLEMTYTHINKLEDIHWELIMKELSPEVRGVISYATLKIVKPEKLYSVELRNIFIEIIFLTQGKDAIYNSAINEINELITLINEELRLPS